MKRISLFLSFLLFFAVIASYQEALAEVKTFIREYTYQASEADSKLTSRAIALEQVKRLLLEELGTYLESQTEAINLQITKDEITILSAGVVQTIILDETWDGKSFWLKAKIDADPDKVITDIGNLRKDKQKAKEYEELKKRADEALIEIERLKEQLADKGGEKANIYITEQIRKETNKLTAKDWLERGDSLFVAGDYKGATDAFSKAIENDPEYLPAYDYRAFVYSARGYNELALDDLNNYIKHAPKDKEHKKAILSLSAFINLSLKEYKKAIDDYTEYIKLDPNNEIGYIGIGETYGKLGDFKKAIIYFDKAIKLSPKDAYIYYNRGNIYLKTFNYGQALDDYNKAIELNPTIGDFYFNRAIVFKELSNYPQAINDYTKTIEIDPGNKAKAYFYRGTVHGLSGENDKAISDIRTAARLGDKEAQAWLTKEGMTW